MLGSSLGMITTAEGVETADQLSILRDAGFAEGQGYFFGAPKPARDLVHALSPAQAAACAA
jgi:EAL domain-containing protein (putative c-di-GMP-specific phosphodiesterase class I)